MPHLHVNGCAGNVAAGKYNDGIADNRELFADGIHDAMIAAEAAGERRPLADLRWVLEPVLLPPRPDLDAEALLARIRAPGAGESKDFGSAALMLTYLRRHERPMPVTCLHFGAEAASCTCRARPSSSTSSTPNQPGPARSCPAPRRRSLRAAIDAVLRE